jgi:hypothetical protein
VPRDVSSAATTAPSAAPSATTPPAPTDPPLTAPDAGEPSWPPLPPDAALADVKARCADPTHGPVAKYADLAGLRDLLIGRWYACDSTEGMVPDPHTGLLIRPELYSQVDGLQFLPGAAGEPAIVGSWQSLKLTDAGVFITQQGIDSSGTWVPEYGQYVSTIEVSWQDSPTLDQEATEFDFESSPTRMRAKNQMSGAMTWFVPMAATTAPPTR